LSINPEEAVAYGATLLVMVWLENFLLKNLEKIF
jgi:hypothetical protein